MDTLVGNATLRFSRRVDGYRYEPLNQDADIVRRRDVHVDHGEATISRGKSYRRHNHVYVMSPSYRRHRARQRQIFLQTYRLSSMDSSPKSRAQKIKRVVVRAKSAVVSVLSFVRADVLRPCRAKSGISVSLPRRVVSCC